jgi:hypothetical protein
MGITVQEVKKNEPVTGRVSQKSDNNLYTYTQMVEKKAYDIYEKRGREHGRDREDWLEAEKLVGRAA